MSPSSILHRDPSATATHPQHVCSTTTNPASNINTNTGSSPTAGSTTSPGEYHQ
eukprot:gnl/Chilomastix_caulleri/3857.p5 GENE.gnl/Chilomastix_caulleri/3857~~gnl/Chilomastix_caulleri/3857.p5  ORF type:complete len:54 (+),score=13.35 gnl/Chilomastix_caulleri/3857:159-320(+)